MSDYIELHLHDHYSALDGLNTPAEYMKRAKEIGMTHLAQTNHATLGGHREFQTEAQKAGIIPILGVEGYISETDRFDRRAKTKRSDGTNVYNHIIMLAQNENGLKNLNKMNEIAWVEGFYSKPRIDLELLEEYSDDLVITSGCLSGLLAKAIERGDPQKAIDHAKNLSRIAPGRFYIEVQGHNPPELNKALLEIADRLQIPAVATSDCHYARKEDLWVQEALLILSTKPKHGTEFDYSKSQKMEILERLNYLYPNRTMTFEKFEIYLHTSEEHRLAFARQGIDREDIYKNTLEIADSVGNYPFHQGLDLLPQPRGVDSDDVLEKKCRAGMKERGHTGIKKYEDRLAEELEIIKAKDFSTYFLIVADAVQWAKKKNIMVGPGRGSGAGSLINYYLKITDVDPIEYSLLFFRFIDPERSDFPDIDMDFQDTRRDEVKEYLRRKFSHVASIATFTYFRDKNVIKDAARVFRVPMADVNAATKNVNAPPGHDFFDVFRASPQGKDFNDKYPEVMKLAAELRGRIRSGGIHAAGLVLSKIELSNFAAIETATNPSDKQGPRISLLAVDMDAAADIGLIKFDFLGLKTLSVIGDTVKLIKERYNLDIDLKNINLEDQNVYKMLSSGNTKGVFQCMLPDQPIHTINGMKMAGNIIKGDIVLTHKGRFRPVLATMRRESKEELYRINLGKQHSDPVYLTGEHPILKSDKDGNMSWTKVSDLTAGRKQPGRSLKGWNDYVVMPKTTTDKNCYFGKFPIDAVFSRFLGLYAAEGCMEESGKMTLTLHKRELDFIEFSQGVMMNTLGMNVRLSHRGNVTYVIGNKKELAGLFRSEFGHGARNKRIPACIMTARQEIIREFLVGYADGDGRILKSGSVGVQTASENLAWGIRALVTNIGCFTEVKSHFRNVFGGKFKVFTLNYHLGEKVVNRVIDSGDYLLIPVSSVKFIGGSHEVVNFEVEEDNSYVSTFVMHNCEATPYTKLLMKMNVDSFNDLAVSNALIRPGAMNVFGDSYLKRKAGKEKSQKIHPDVDPFLEDTFFLPIYQEQSMRLVSDLAGMGMSTANKVRKITAKKQDVKLLAEYRQQFIDGASPKVGLEKAEFLWGSIEETASYAFNLSHSVAYSMVSYWTAWLKHYYPQEFMVSILNNEEDKDSVTDYLIETKRLGMRVLLPHVNKSKAKFSIEGENIRMGLSNVKFISHITASKIIDKAPYENYTELQEWVGVKGNGLNVRCLTGLNAIAGAEFEDNPRHGGERDNFYEYLGIPEFDVGSVPGVIKTQISNLNEYQERGVYLVRGMVRSIKQGDGWSRVDIVDHTGSAGIFAGEHDEIETGQLYILLVSDNRIARLCKDEEITENKDFSFVKYLWELDYPDMPKGMYKVVSFKGRKTKTGTNFANMIVADSDKDLTAVVVFDQIYQKALLKCKQGEVVDLQLEPLRGGGVTLRNVL